MEIPAAARDSRVISPRVRFDDVVDGEVSGRPPVDTFRRDEGAGPRPAAAVCREVDAGTGAPVFVCPDCRREITSGRCNVGVGTRCGQAIPGKAKAGFALQAGSAQARPDGATRIGWWK